VSTTIAHRQELVGQISMALSRDGVEHNIIAPIKLIKYLIGEQMSEFKRSFYRPDARAAVAGVDTLLRRKDALRSHLRQTTLWVMDEGHHLVIDNKWGKAVALMPNARGLSVSATPTRTDRIGLGRHAGGVIDVMVQGPTMRDLIAQGYLTDYRIFAPPSDLDLGQVTVSAATGEYVSQKLKKAVQESHLVGDVVDHYKRIAMGKRGVTFATDVETATEIAVRFREAGVPAEVVSAKTPDHIRNALTKQLATGKLLQLVNVDLFGEGFDLPAIEVVSMARPTMSYSLYVQQFGRALRIIEGKERAIIIDHAGNVVRHGLPDRERIWSLDGGPPKAERPEDDIPLRYCTECTRPYERFLVVCPYCGHHPVPEDRSAPEFVDGDLYELTPEVLAEMRSAVASADESPEMVRDRMVAAGAPRPAYLGAMARIRDRHDAVAALRESISWWAGYQNWFGRSDRESHKLFYHLFGIDVLTAQTLSRKDTIELAEKINDHLGAMRNDTRLQNF
jgi:superfamily II DNA or RNA helicase